MRHPSYSLFISLILLTLNDYFGSNAFSYQPSTRTKRKVTTTWRSQPAFETVNPSRRMRKPTNRQQQSTSLQMTTPSPVGAVAALVGSSFLGLLVDRKLPNCGIAVTLIVAALLSNTTSWIPASHPLYDMCWTLFLPASLALLLLAYRPQEGSRTKEGPSISKNDGTSISSCIQRVSVPFLVASFGSLLGCWTSFQCSRIWNWFSLDNARAATACLSASYVGGSVNFFATGRLIRANTELLGSLATADLLVMALYFTFLSLSLDWKWLRSKFYESDNSTDGAVSAVQDTSNPATTSEAGSFPKSLFAKFLTSIPLLGLTFLIVQAANLVEGFLGRWIPGTACAVIALVAPIINSWVNPYKWWLPFSDVAIPIADFLFLSFFASIGIGANLKSALQMGPACLVFSFLALSIHLVVAVVGSLPFAHRFRVELEDVWIASNAAIGGPATAAAFCNRLRNPEKLKGRTMAATVFGVGTSISYKQVAFLR